MKPDDIQEKFVRSGGKGGQNVNKVSTCVQLKHLPTGLTVKCEVYRTQNKNRQMAMKLLRQKIAHKEETRINKIIDEREKNFRATRKKPRAIKEEILKNKKINSEKKLLRKKVLI